MIKNIQYRLTLSAFQKAVENLDYLINYQDKISILKITDEDIEFQAQYVNLLARELEDL